MAIRMREYTLFDDRLFNFVQREEATVRRIYSDPLGIPTLGVGFALIVRASDGSYKYRYATDDDAGNHSFLGDTLSFQGINLSADDWLLLDQVLADLNSGQPEVAKLRIPTATQFETNANGGPEEPALVSNDLNRFSIGLLDDTKVRSLYDTAMNETKETVRTKLGNFVDGSGSVYDALANSQELAALLSLAYNSPSLIGPRIIAALQNQDHAEAWYEIRYNSSAAGIHADRRYREADLFGFYNVSPTEEDYKAAYRTFTRHQEEIWVYEASNPPPTTIDYELRDARSWLVSAYVDLPGFGINIDGTILVGENDGRNGTQDTTYYLGYDNDNLTGTGQNDLIFGESGMDVLHGGAGNDVIYGGDDADFLYGDGGNDYLIGETGDDVLFGGTGFDEYRANAGDTIQDVYESTNAGGKILLTDKNNLQIKGGTREFGTETWRDRTNGITYTRYGSDLWADYSGVNGNSRVVVDNYFELASAGYTNGTYSYLGITLEQKRNGGNTYIGTNGADVLEGSKGDDILNGLLGRDTLIGGAGDDIYYVQAERQDYWVARDNVVEVAGEGTDWVYLMAGSFIILPDNVENLVMLDSVDRLRYPYEYDYNWPVGVGNNMANIIIGQAGTDSLHGMDGDDYIDGSAGHDLINGGDGNDILIGGDGDDSITGNGNDDNIIYHDGGVFYLDGNDRIEGGPGSDYLQGDYGDDVYVFGLGDGHDRIFDTGGHGDIDTVEFKAGIQPADVVFQLVREWYSSDWGMVDYVYLTISNTDDSIFIGDRSNPWSNPHWKVERITFADGTVWEITASGLVPLNIVNGGNGNDALYGGVGYDAIEGNNGSDQIYGEGGNDTLRGGNGDDVLYGGAGDDALYDGQGDDFLAGGTGNDTYFLGKGTNTVYFESGDGSDTLIQDAALLSSPGGDHGNNEVDFGTSISKETLWFMRRGDDLAVNLLGSSDSLIVRDWYSAQHALVDTFKTADGSTLLATQVELLVQAMASFSPTPGSGQLLPTEMPEQLQPVLAAAWESS